MGWLRVAGAASLLVCLNGCGFGEKGLGETFGPGEDGGEGDGARGNSDAGRATDAAGEEAAPDATPPPCSVPAGACTASIPAGWALAAFAQRAAVCPSGWTGQAVVSDPQAQPGACDCSCNVTTHPSCEVGTLQRWVSSDNSCSAQGAQFAVNGPYCTALTGQSPLAVYGQASPLPPTGGVCDAQPVSHDSMVVATAGQSCTPPVSCEEQVCGGDVPAGFGACLVGPSGATTCPSGWGKPLAIGDATTLACSACTCDVDGPSTCTGAALTYYGDSQCSGEIARVTIDGTCSFDPGNGLTPYAFSYAATLDETCATMGPKTATVGLTNARTVCCKP